MKQLESVYPIADPWPDDINAFLRQRFAALQGAVQVVRPYIRNKRGFDAAWLGYYKTHPDVIDGQSYHLYVSSHDPFLRTQRMADANADADLRMNIRRLLSFAQDT